MPEKNFLFVYNLSTQVRIRHLKNNIHMLLQETGIPLRKNKIYVQNNAPREVYAELNFDKRRDEAVAAYRLLKARVKSQEPKVADIVASGKQLYVDLELSDDTTLCGSQNDQFDDYSSSNSDPTTAWVKNSSYGDSNDTTMQQRCYSLGQHIGAETRVTEFKRGGGKKKEGMASTVGKYMCAFLNSEGGVLYIGVDDGGIVRGTACNQEEEDLLRQKIDGIISRMRPDVFPDVYRVDFIPVLNQTGTLELRNLKVITVTVNLPGKRHNGCRLYESEGKVYMRRDGSIQTLKPHQIQEWLERKLKEGQEKLYTEMRNERQSGDKHQKKPVQWQGDNMKNQPRSEISNGDFSNNVALWDGKSQTTEIRHSNFNIQDSPNLKSTQVTHYDTVSVPKQETNTLSDKKLLTDIKLREKKVAEREKELMNIIKEQEVLREQIEYLKNQKKPSKVCVVL